MQHQDSAYSAIMRILMNKAKNKNYSLVFCSSSMKVCIQWKCKVKQSHYRPGQALRIPGGWGSQILDNRHMKVVRLSALGTDRLYPKETFLVFSSVRDWVDLRTIVRPEGLCQWKNPMTPSEIEPATFRLVAQYLN